MKTDKSSGSDDWYVPPDIGSFLGPLLLVVCFFAAMQQHSIAVMGGDTSLFTLALVSSAIGVALLFLARWPLYRQGRIFSFGPHHVDRLHRNLYYLAYVFIVPSILFLGFLVMFLRQ